MKKSIKFLTMSLVTLLTGCAGNKLKWKDLSLDEAIALAEEISDGAEARIEQTSFETMSDYTSYTYEETEIVYERHTTTRGCVDAKNLKASCTRVGQFTGKNNYLYNNCWYFYEPEVGIVCLDETKKLQSIEFHKYITPCDNIENLYGKLDNQSILACMIEYVTYDHYMSSSYVDMYYASLPDIADYEKTKNMLREANYQIDKVEAKTVKNKKGYISYFMSISETSHKNYESDVCECKAVFKDYFCESASEKEEKVYKTHNGVKTIDIEMCEINNVKKNVNVELPADISIFKPIS